MISVLIAYLMLAMPLSTTIALAQSSRVNIPSVNIPNPDFLENEPTSELDALIGEDIAISVDQYQPQVIPTGLIEDQGATIFALLEANPTNPTITIPQIDRVDTRVKKITTIPEGKPVSVGVIRHLPPRAEELSYNNLGHLIIPLRPIPREEDVPESIQIDMDARIYFQVSSGLTFGPRGDVLTEQSYDDWLSNKEDHHFYAGYIQATEIEDTQATFLLYDDSVREASRPITLREGQRSSQLSTSRYGVSGFGRLFDRFTITVNDIRAQSDRVRVFITKDDVTTSTVLSKGESVYQGSGWSVSKITEKPNNAIEVELRNPRKGTEVLKISQQAEPSTTPSAPVPVTITASIESPIDIINKKIIEAQKESTEKETQYSTIISEIQTLLQKSETAPHEKSQLLSLLSKIYNDELTQWQQVERSLERNPSDPVLKERGLTIKKLLDAINAILIQHESSIPTQSSPVRSDLKENDLYELAIASYKTLAETYRQTRYNEETLAAEALYRIARIQWLHLNDTVSATQTFDQLLATYTAEELNAIEPQLSAKVKETIGVLKRFKTTYDYKEATRKLQEFDKSTFIISLHEVEKIPEEDRPTAYIFVNGFQSAYRDGDKLATGGDLLWEIEKIENEGVTLKSGTTKVRLNANDQQAQSIKINAAGTVALVQLAEIDMKREVHITVSPVAERAFTDSSFTLRIPIEKRPFGLPLFSDTLTEEIGKTEKLLVKVTKIIDDVTKLHDYWKKFCFITFGVLFLKNIVFTGGSTVVARNKVNTIYKERYANGQLEECKNAKSYEECIFMMEDDYEADLDRAEQIIDEIDDDKHKSLFQSLPEEYDDDRKDVYFYSRMKAAHPDDEEIASQYYASAIDLRKREIEQGVFQTFYEKDKLKPYEANQEKIDAIIGSSDTLAASGPTKKDIFEEHKQEIIELERRDRLSTDLHQYFTDLQDGKVRDISVTGASDKDILSKLATKEFTTPPATNEISKFNIRTDTDGMTKYVHLDNFQKRALSRAEITAKVFTEEGITYKIVDKTTIETAHKPELTLVTGGRAEGKVQHLTVDGLRYLEVSYSATGKVENVDVFEKRVAQDQIGSGHRLAAYEDELQIAQRSDQLLAKKLKEARGCVDQANTKLTGRRYQRGEVIADCGLSLGTYRLSNAVQEIGPSCTDMMDPDDCKLLFNACDPIICPSSRCNLGGTWQTNNVIETGLIGSAVLCLPNFPQVLVPVCLTGIVAGLQNIRSIIAGYKECLIAAQVEGRSIGICDRIRSFGICEMIWREAIAIFNIKEGVIGGIGRWLGFEVKGGGEYASFSQTMDNAVNSLEYFTQDYAKNTFARYSGGSLPEIGGEICKAAIFGKAPGIGNFFDQVLQPESPPQFTAFFDEAPVSDIPNQPVSLYSVFYHIYAGENEPITYSVYLQAKDDLGKEFLAPIVIIRQTPLNQGDFHSQNIDLQLVSGYNEICVDIRSNTYGQIQRCGFRKISTEYLVSLVNDKIVESEVQKNINTEEECRPQTGRYTTLSGQDIGASSAISQIPRAAVAGFSTGLLETGIVRKCSTYDPDVGTQSDDWVPVGSCGIDDRERDLGTCWLYRPGAQNLIKDLEIQQRAFGSDGKGGTVNDLVRKTLEERDIPDVVVLKENEIVEHFKKAKDLRLSVRNETEKGRYQQAINLYEEIINSYFIDEISIARALFEKGKTYEEWAGILSRPVIDLTSVEPIGVGSASSGRSEPTVTDLFVDEDGFTIYASYFVGPVPEEAYQADEGTIVLSDGTVLYPYNFEGELDQRVPSRKARNIDEWTDYSIKLIYFEGLVSSSDGGSGLCGDGILEPEKGEQCLTQEECNQLFDPSKGFVSYCDASDCQCKLLYRPPYAGSTDSSLPGLCGDGVLNKDQGEQCEFSRDCLSIIGKPPVKGSIYYCTTDCQCKENEPIITDINILKVAPEKPASFADLTSCEIDFGGRGRKYAIQKNPTGAWELFWEEATYKTEGSAARGGEREVLASTQWVSAEKDINTDEWKQQLRQELIDNCNSLVEYNARLSGETVPPDLEPKKTDCALSTAYFATKPGEYYVKKENAAGNEQFYFVIEGNDLCDGLIPEVGLLFYRPSEDTPFEYPVKTTTIPSVFTGRFSVLPINVETLIGSGKEQLVLKASVSLPGNVQSERQKLYPVELPIDLGKRVEPTTQSSTTRRIDPTIPPTVIINKEMTKWDYEKPTIALFQKRIIALSKGQVQVQNVGGQPSPITLKAKLTFEPLLWFDRTEEVNLKELDDSLDPWETQIYDLKGITFEEPDKFELFIEYNGQYGKQSISIGSAEV